MSSTDTVTFSNNTGPVTVTSNNTSIATAAVSGNNINITGVGVGSTTITVNVGANGDYGATSRTISVNVSQAQQTQPEPEPQTEEIIDGSNSDYTVVGHHSVIMGTGDVFPDIFNKTCSISTTSGSLANVNFAIGTGYNTHVTSNPETLRTIWNNALTRVNQTSDGYVSLNFSRSTGEIHITGLKKHDGSSGNYRSFVFFWAGTTPNTPTTSYIDVLIDE